MTEVQDVQVVFKICLVNLRFESSRGPKDSDFINARGRTRKTEQTGPSAWAPWNQPQAGSLGQWINELVTQWPSGSVIQWFNDSVVQ